MILLIFIPDLIFFLIGWDGLGLIRFLLIIFYLRKNSFKAGIKTYFINRLGDGFFIIGFGILVIQKNWLLISLKKRIVLGILFSLGCFTKSAQFPFSSWLPDAMAAPTPVSALVHSRTLVTAGIFCLIRFFYCLKDTFFFSIWFNRFLNNDNSKNNSLFWVWFKEDNSLFHIKSIRFNAYFFVFRFSKICLFSFVNSCCI